MVGQAQGHCDRHSHYIRDKIKGKGRHQTQAVLKSQLGKPHWVSRPWSNPLWQGSALWAHGPTLGAILPLSWRVARDRSRVPSCFLSVEFGEDNSLLLFCPSSLLSGASRQLLTSSKIMWSPMYTSWIPSIRQEVPSRIFPG